MAVTANLSQYVGDNTTYQVTIFQSDGVTLQDITNWNITFKVCQVGDYNTVYIVKSVGSGIVLTSPSLGVLQITVVRGDTLVLVATQYEFTIERTDPGSEAVLTHGFFTLAPKS